MATNIIAVTIDNHTVMQQSGVHPIRRAVKSGNYIKDGTTTEHDWVGLVPAEDRIHIFDPPKGYFVHANNKVAESEYYGGYLDYTIYTARADRIDELIREEIASGRKINSDFAKKVLHDTVDVYCRQILHEIVAVVPESQSVFSGFDCDFKGESSQATVY
jgi:penicillin amidase